MVAQPIFIHSLFRSGSTYLFNAFRRSDRGYWCYQEPLNEHVRHVTQAPERLLDLDSGHSALLRHPVLQKPYFWEFYEVRDAIAPYFKKELSYDWFFAKTGEPAFDDTLAYFRALIEAARGRPMLQCCRTFGRARALREALGGVHLHLWRNPRDQWWSYQVSEYFDATTLLILNAQEVPRVLADVKTTCGIKSFHANEIDSEFSWAVGHRLASRESYRAFYALWLYSMLESEAAASLSINIDALSSSPQYRNIIFEALNRQEVLGLDFSDCNIAHATFDAKETTFFQAIEDDIHQLFAAQSDDRRSLSDALDLRTRYEPRREQSTGRQISEASRAREAALRQIDLLAKIEGQFAEQASAFDSARHLAEEQRVQLSGKEAALAESQRTSGARQLQLDLARTHIQRIEQDLSSARDELRVSEAIVSGERLKLEALHGQHAETLVRLGTQEGELSVARGRGDELQHELSGALSRIVSLEHDVTRWYGVAEKLHKDFHDLCNSRSWRLTAPLRHANAFVKRCAQVVRAFARTLAGVPSAATRHLTIVVWRHLHARPARKDPLINLLIRYPFLHKKVRVLASRYAQDFQSTIAISPALKTAPERDGSGIDWANYPASVRRVYSDLAQARARDAVRPSNPDVDSSAARTPRRPRLAYLSPLPPERSGIADYSAELLPELSKHYEIDAIITQPAVADEWIRSNIPVRSAQWFDQNAHVYDRVLYHFGNSPFHEHMFRLLDRHPGTVVLHDFFLGHAIAHMDRTGGWPGAWDEALYVSHGYRAVKERAVATDAADVIWKYPANLAVLERADGVIVHSEYARELADRWYGDGYASDWANVALLRSPREILSKSSARKALRLADDDFLVCCFGMMGPTKLNLRLIEAWFASTLSLDPKCRLVFVGENNLGAYAVQCAAAIDRPGLANPIRTTGFAPPSLYRKYLAAADIAVQLRGMSRGETSASALECMSYGLPTIVNALGAMAELPSDCAFKLPEPFSQLELVTSMELLRKDPKLRLALGERARAHVRAHHRPSDIAVQYFDAIERFAQTAAARTVLPENPSGPADPVVNATATDLLESAQCIAQNRQTDHAGPRQWLVDISALVRHDPRSGIQRVVRAVMLSWLNEPPEGFRVEPVFYDQNGVYRYARQFSRDILGLETAALVDEPIETRHGDVLIALDLFLHMAAERRPVYDDMRRRGMRLYFVVYDLLPVHYPQFFPDGVDTIFKSWLTLVGEFANGAACISRTVADELIRWLEESQLARRGSLGIAWFHLGADIAAALPARSAEPHYDQLVHQLGNRPTILMVGTIEPRKGHAQTLAAFDFLWAHNVEVNLVIAGRIGWLVDSPVAKTLRAHPQLDRRLFWFDNASDEQLLNLYTVASGVLMASEGEGFGLPLIEAAQQARPLLVRDLPIFREVIGDNARYFSGLSAESLATAIEAWLVELHEGSAPNSARQQFLTWQDSAKQLTDIIRAERWTLQWSTSRTNTIPEDRNNGSPYSIGANSPPETTVPTDAASHRASWTS